MRYDKDTDQLLLSVREMVSIARRGISSTLPCDTDEPEIPAEKLMGKSSENESFSELNFNFTAGEHSFNLYGKAEVLSGKILLNIPVDSSPKRPKREVITQARGEGYIYAYMLCEKEDIDTVTLSYKYYNVVTGETHEVSEQIKQKKAKTFFEKCKTSIIVYAKPEIERVTIRLPSMKKIKFPYQKTRDGQGDIARGVYNAIWIL